MRDYGTAINDLIANSEAEGLIVRRLLWIRARNRETGVIEPTGFWSGMDVRDFVVEGESRQYFGTVTLMGAEPIKGEIGLNVRFQTLSLSQIPPKTAQLINNYSLQNAQVEVHRVFFDTLKGVQVGDPVRLIKGNVDTMPIPTPSVGETVNIKMRVATSARNLTRRLTSKKTDATQRLVNANDAGRLYGATPQAIEIFWNGKSKRGFDD